MLVAASTRLTAGNRVVTAPHSDERRPTWPMVVSPGMGRELSIGKRYRLKDEAGVNHEADGLTYGRAEIAMVPDFVADSPLGFTTRVDFAGAMDDHGAHRLNGESAACAAMALHWRSCTPTVRVTPVIGGYLDAWSSRGCGG
jgi:hypothetical protein